MAYANIELSRFSDLGLAARFRKVLDVLSQRAGQAAVYRQTVRELQSLGNRDLADLGIHRSEIRRIATEAAYGA